MNEKRRYLIPVFLIMVVHALDLLAYYVDLTDPYTTPPLGIILKRVVMVIATVTMVILLIFFILEYQKVHSLSKLFLLNNRFRALGPLIIFAGICVTVSKGVYLDIRNPFALWIGGGISTVVCLFCAYRIITTSKEEELLDKKEDSSAHAL